MKFQALQSLLLSCILLSGMSAPKKGQSRIQPAAQSLVLFSKAAVRWDWRISEFCSGWRNTGFRLAMLPAPAWAA